MYYKIFHNGKLINTITADEAFCKSYCERNGYTFEAVDDSQKLSPSQKREEAYNTQAIIEWDDSMLTVTEAAQKWQYYAAEGNTVKTDELTALIADAKASIREQYPDE